jgi:CRISPR-associated protein Cas8b1/Cst1 subtype I-B
MLLRNKKKLIIVLIYTSFFIAIPIIKNESRLIEKKIQSYQSKIFTLEKKLLEASLEFQYLASPAVLSSNIKKNSDQKYDNLDLSQIYLNIEDFMSEKNKITKILINEK